MIADPDRQKKTRIRPSRKRDPILNKELTNKESEREIDNQTNRKIRLSTIRKHMQINKHTYIKADRQKLERKPEI